jgi:hypothetical protein
MEGSSIVDHCAATNNGGGIYCCRNATLRDSAKIINCEAQYGGGIRIETKSSKPTATLEVNGEGVKISNNKAICSKTQLQPY